MLRFAATCATALALLIPAVPAQADMTLNQFRNYSTMPGGTPLVRSYLGGLRDGIVEYQDALAEHQDVAPTFCPDGDELAQGTRFEEVLLGEIADPSSGEAWAGGIQMSRIAVHALQQAFPCESY